MPRLLRCFALFLLISAIGNRAPLRAQLIAPSFTQIIVFGDSLSDTGNVRDRTDSTSGGTINYPSQTFNYSDGRFTNSSDTDPSSITYVGLWHEQLARTFLHIPAATFSLNGGFNYAFGGARTEDGVRAIAIVPTPIGDLVINIDDMGRQMDRYLFNNPIDPNALYIIWGGANDMFNDDSPANVTATATRVTNLVGRLANAGAQHILVPNLPPLGALPASAEDQQTVLDRNSASASFRTQLDADLTAMLNSIAPQGITPNVYRVDVWRNMIRLFSNPAVNGFTNTQTEAQGNQSANPDQFLFWDGVHPTTAGHYWAAQAANAALTTPVTPPGKAINISTRLFVDIGERVSIAGFIVTGNSPKRILLRGIGPSLGNSGVPDPLADTTLALYDETGTLLMANDNWRETQETEISETGIPPQNDLESAIVTNLQPGRYTVFLAGKNETSGNGLAEVYDLDPGADSTLANLSTRGFVGSGDDALIGGIIISEGDNPATVMRAIGPSLAGANIANPLSDPTIELHDGNGAVVGFNDNWRDSQLQAVQALQLAPTDDRESAIVAFPAPGTYTAIVRGNANSTGIALVEVYRIL